MLETETNGSIKVDIDDEEELKKRAEAVGLPDDATEEQIKQKEKEAKEKPEEDTITLKKEELEKMKRQINYASGSYRIIEKLEREIEDLKKTKPVPSAKEDEELTDINKLIDEDLVGGITKIVDHSIKKAMNKSQQEEQLKIMEETRNKQIKLLNENQGKVLQKHPELTDPLSEKSKVWFEVLEQHPEYRTNYLGPLQTMRDMEEKLESKDVDKDKNKNIEKEIERRRRAEQANLGKGKGVVKDSEVILTKEQKELCDRHGWDYKQYARTLKRLSGEKQVEVE